MSAGLLCKGLARAGLDVAAVSIEPAEGWNYEVRPAKKRAGSKGNNRPGPPLIPEEVDGVRLLRAPGDRAWEPAVRLAVAWQPTVIHFHEYRDSRLVRHLAELTGASVVTTLHELFVDEAGQPGSSEDRRGQSVAIELADRIIVPSRGALDRFTRHHPSLRQRTRRLGHGIEDDPVAREAAFGRTRGQVTTLLYCGRVSRQKGVDVLLSALPRVLAQSEDIRFVLAGLQDYPRQRRMLDDWLSELPAGQAARVTTRGWLPRPQLGELYARAEVAIVPSRNEIFGLVVLEAMLYGCAVVAAGTDGAAELLDEGRTGLLVAPGDPEALAMALLGLIEDPKLTGRLGQAAAAEVRKGRLLEQTTPKMIAVYEELLRWALPRKR